MAKKRRVSKSRRSRRKSGPKYRIRNWTDYNTNSVQRGSITFWVGEDVINAREAQGDGPRKRGGQRLYWDMAIERMLTIRAVFHPPLRAMEDFARSLFELMDLKLPVPDYSTVCKRANLTVNLPKTVSDGPIHVVVDSTRLKIFGSARHHPCRVMKTCQIRKMRRRRWKQVSDYQQHSLAETAVFRFKIVSGDHLRSRTLPQQVTEATIKCATLNRMTQLGMPNSYRV